MASIYPALTPLKSQNSRHHELSGLTLQVELSVGEGRRRRRTRGGFLFTHRGYSGPTVLDLSDAWIRDPSQNVRVNWAQIEPQVWESKLLGQSSSVLRRLLREELPARLVDLLLDECELEPTLRTGDLRRDQRQRLLGTLLQYPLPISGHEGYRKAEVTGGGVRLEEVDLQAGRCRKHPGLFLCGEVLNAFGPIGGHNFAWAWATGRLAGRGAASG